MAKNKNRRRTHLALTVVVVAIAGFGLAWIYFIAPKSFTSPDHDFSLAYPRNWNDGKGFITQCSFDNCVGQIAFNPQVSANDKNNPQFNIAEVKSTLSAKEQLHLRGKE